MLIQGHGILPVVLQDLGSFDPQLGIFGLEPGNQVQGHRVPPGAGMDLIVSDFIIGQLMSQGPRSQAGPR